MDDNNLIFSDLTRAILGCSFDVMNILGAGFLEAIYKNALILEMKEKGLHVEVEKKFHVIYKNQKIGMYTPDLLVNDTVIIELKCCEQIISEHQAQLINYLKTSEKLVGLLINFGRRKLQYKRVSLPDFSDVCDHVHPLPF